MCAARFASRSASATGGKTAGVTGFSLSFAGGTPLIDRRQKTIVCPTGLTDIPKCCFVLPRGASPGQVLGVNSSLRPSLSSRIDFWLYPATR
ncbi:hypothetical protein SBA3_3180007 [Candidatus Sulfopaludibacter sp. SbA3]|nr:hypothetical protein SBA3_3180007 [Candidatus Sulfopaludibacter sp. SbA3]